MKLETFMVYLSQSKATLPNDGNFRENAHKAFDKYKQFINNQDPELTDVYKNFDELFVAMKEHLSSYTVRNYTHALSIALTLDHLKGVFTDEEVQQYSEQIKKALKEANKKCNEEKKKKKASQASASTSDLAKETENEHEHVQQTSDFECSDSETVDEQITLDDLEGTTTVEVDTNNKNINTTVSDSQQENKRALLALQDLVSELQQQVREDKIRISMLTQENNKLWALANAIVRK